MMSCKGFLSPDANRRPRMTAKHKIAILTALAAARDHYLDTGDLDPVAQMGLSYAELMIALTLEDYPTDRSCHTCDFFLGVHCNHWKQDVPPDAVEVGCDEHAEHGAPF